MKLSAWATGAAMCLAEGVALAADALPEQSGARLEALQAQIAEQGRQIDALRRMLTQQESALTDMKRQQAAVEPSPPSPPPVSVVAPAPALVRAPAPPPPVATVAVTEQPGVLTPPGKVVVEPSLQYSYSSSNRVALVGYTVIPSILVGVVDVREVKRSSFIGAFTARFGVTRRLELEGKIPYVYRSDTSIGRELLQGTSTSSAFDASGHGLGDIEVTARYQLNDGGQDRPYYIGSLRMKSRTGKDPFQVMTSRGVVGFTNEGIQNDLPTGSGFFGVQPAITALYPSDPAVFFGTLSYLHSFRRDNVVRNTDSGPEALGTIAPGGIIGFNFGMGLALNDKSSFNIGYDHNSVGKTKQNGSVAADSVRLQLGTLLLGYSYRLSPERSLNISLGAGLTRDTPDVTLTVRIPTTL